MPTYDIQCGACRETGSLRLSFSGYDLVKSGESILRCNQCDGVCQILFEPSQVQFVLKDSASGGWASKALKENAYRANRRNYMAKRERDNVFKPTLQPNYNGVETGTWRDAQEYARSEVAADHGKKAGDIAATTYQPLVVKETKKT